MEKECDICLGQDIKGKKEREEEDPETAVVSQWWRRNTMRATLTIYLPYDFCRLPTQETSAGSPVPRCHSRSATSAGYSTA